jgi:hypothetical protein
VLVFMEKRQLTLEKTTNINVKLYIDQISFL